MGYHACACLSLALLSLRLRSFGTVWIYDRLRNWTAIRSHATDEPGWILTFARVFTMCPYTERYLSDFKMASPSWVTTPPCNRARPLPYKTLDGYGVLTAQVKFSTATDFLTARSLNFRTVKEVPWKPNTYAHELSNGSKIRPAPCERGLSEKIKLLLLA